MCVGLTGCLKHQRILLQHLTTLRTAPSHRDATHMWTHGPVTCAEQQQWSGECLILRCCCVAQARTLNIITRCKCVITVYLKKPDAGKLMTLSRLCVRRCETILFSFLSGWKHLKAQVAESEDERKKIACHACGDCDHRMKDWKKGALQHVKHNLKVSD